MRPGDVDPTCHRLTSLSYGISWVFRQKENTSALIPQATRVYTNLGWVYLLGGRYIPLLKNETRLGQEFQSTIPGYEPYYQLTADHHILQHYTRSKMSLQLGKPSFGGKLVKPVSRNTARTLHKMLGDSQEWSRILIRETAGATLSEAAGSLFYGPDIAADPEFGESVLRYLTFSIAGMPKLHLWPQCLRPIVHWLLPTCRAARAELAKSRARLTLLLVKQKKERQKADDLDQIDVFSFIETLPPDQRGDPACLAIALTIAATHTTATLLTTIIYQICKHPDLIEPLRAEIRSVIQEHGWTKAGITKLRLMNSVMKETNRLSPLSQAIMRRVATADVPLNRDLTIPKGAITMTSTLDTMWDPQIYPDPQKFDGYRYLNLAKQDPYWNRTSSFVATSPESLGFGLGKEACPGRFIADLEIKLILCYLLTHYDIKLPGGITAKPRYEGVFLLLDPGDILIRRRPEEEAKFPDWSHDDQV
ncbi:cytochrome P450 [Aspergillus fischeri NRRL 181]|uniref:Cytochrome P450 oxidoreductase, putative n=1 Tax=Neosartorya fischeri (strain ATCC 1020 / DSM 3700 / CBS 544.65 / FGSC A1164 / JCM 1740 / NRRL 181 / WB 181) TaxID=331117 RepID=A1DK95_NEOFI|nr:Cytochrome P450 oxidoreductase, putative [Aspergillus fischeri NRRL 181]EAW17134.1 Cytochrome P450 oxidoreductase, putative [Aspergillus fischeri NRRL 181]